MLVKATEEEIEQYMDLAYALAMDQTRSGYPLWSDGISTKAEFVEFVWRSYRDPDRELLLFMVDGVVEGWIQFFYLEQDRYLQTNGFLIRRNTEQAFTEFFEYARAHFAGYDLYLGFPRRNTEATSFLQKSGCKLISESYHDIFLFDGSAIPAGPDGIVRVTEDNFFAFRDLHHTAPETYWTSDRIFSTLDEWLIYLLYREGTAAAYVCARNGEIFALGYRGDVFDRSAYKALVSAILRDLQAAGHKHMVFFNDDEESQSAALELGFSCVGEYVLFVKRV